MAEHTGQSAAEDRVARVARELARCRQRGIDDLDVEAHNKELRETPELNQLAADYRRATGGADFGRVAAIRTLIQDGLAAYAAQGHEPESRFMTSLFFDASGASTQPIVHGLLQTAQEALGFVDGKPFAEYRRARFIRFAAFLIAFVAASAAGGAAQEDGPPLVGEEPVATSAPAPWWSRRTHVRGEQRVLVAAGALMSLVLIGVMIAAIVLTHQPPTAPPTAGAIRHAASTTGPVGSGGVTSGIVTGHTYTEMTGEFGAPTFSDPRHPAVTGIRIQPYQTVQVVCKVYAPTIPSASPDGYWYRIATAPWNGRYYAVANTFMNGDKIGAPAMHNTDFAVPDCPSS